MNARKPLRALVLSGGGAKGAFEAGLVTTLITEYHEEFDIICGTSIGAINAAFVAQDDLAGLGALWHTIAGSALITPYPKIAVLQRLLGVIRNAGTKTGLARLLAYVGEAWAVIVALAQLRPLASLARITGACDPAHIETLLASRLRLQDVRRVLIATATDLTTRLPAAFYRFPQTYTALEPAFARKEPQALHFSAEAFADAIRASAAIPGAFAPVGVATDLQLRFFVDGGVANNTPIGQAIDAGATEITVVYLDPEQPAPEPIRTTSLATILYGCYSVMQQRLLALDYEMALRTNEIACEPPSMRTSRKRTVKLRKFAPTSPLAVGVLDFSNQALIDACFEQGCAAARDDVARLHYRTR